MRDARAQGAQERGGRRTRDLARRGNRAVTLAESFARLAVAILIDATAFIIWDLGTRPPSRLAADIRGAFARRRGLILGAARFLGGFALLVLAAQVVIPVVHVRDDFYVVESLALFAALAVELLVGDAVRRRQP